MRLTAFTDYGVRILMRLAGEPERLFTIEEMFFQCARALKRADTKLQVTLIEPNQTYISCPFSNEVIAGLRQIEAHASMRRACTSALRP